MDFISPDGTERVSSYKLNHDTNRKFLRGLGWSEDKGPMRPYMKRLGWMPKIVHGKKKWVWFEGTRDEKAYLKGVCRYEFLPYPKRQTASELKGATSPLTVGGEPITAMIPSRKQTSALRALV